MSLYLRAAVQDPGGPFGYLGYDARCGPSLYWTAAEARFAILVRVGNIGRMDIEFSGEIWFWRGPSPWYFVTVPAKECQELKAMSGFVTYGWGMIPASVRIGRTQYKTSLWPKDGSYIVPIKASVRKAESLDEGDTVTVRLRVG